MTGAVFSVNIEMTFGFLEEGGNDAKNPHCDCQYVLRKLPTLNKIYLLFADCGIRSLFLTTVCTFCMPFVNAF